MPDWGAPGAGSSDQPQGEGGKALTPLCTNEFRHWKA
jgi:hypothetical protein